MKKILTITFICFLSLFANAVNIGKLTYNITSDHTAEVTGLVGGYSAAEGDLIIPESIEYQGNTYYITAIGDMAFFDCKGFTGSLIIPNTVVTIGDYAFNDCNGFTGDLTIPDSVTFIGEYAFEYCHGFNGNLTIPNSLTCIGVGVFRECTRLSGALVIPNSVTSIGEYAFQNCLNLTDTLTIPSSVISIGIGAFTECSGFTNLIIGNSVEEIGCGAFDYCDRLTTVVSLNETPPVRTYDRWSEDDWIFGSPMTESGTLYVPSESIDAYKNSVFGLEIKNIKPLTALAPKPTDMILQPTELRLTPGESYSLTATLIPETSTEREITWTSSNETITTVTDGTVTAVGIGTATIIATCGSVTSTCAVTVIEDNSAIESMDVDSKSDVSVSGSDIMAPEGSNVYNLMGNCVNHTDLPKGIYIVRTPADKTVKVRL
ncbi:MAG: leucine-rich repeat protein [Duncaniella sp.]|nr:leucine-rich repeat protein [Duncaniella sp.]